MTGLRVRYDKRIELEVYEYGEEFGDSWVRIRLPGQGTTLINTADARRLRDWLTKWLDEDSAKKGSGR